MNAAELSFSQEKKCSKMCLKIYRSMKMLGHSPSMGVAYSLTCKSNSFSWERFCTWPPLACENIRFSSLFATGYVSRGGTPATQRQKFHTDDANQCLHNKSDSHGVPNINLSNFACLLVNFCKVLCLSANELQQNSNASSLRRLYPRNIDCFVRDSSRLHLTFLAFCLSSVVRKQ